jgi:outer membrane protein OmpA-like peptidoglycan-associated protein
VAVLVADIPDKQRPGIDVIQVEDKPMDKGMASSRTSTPSAAGRPDAGEPNAATGTDPSLDAAAMGKTLANAGQVNVYGIHFDFDKADIKAESKPQLDEIAKLLSANPGLKLRVTGHTDNIGGTEHNQLLSKRRADAIVAALADNYGVAAERLTSAGLGASLPVASNGNEEGRAMNRRVELIRQ